MNLLNKKFSRGQFIVQDQKPDKSIVLKQVHGNIIHHLIDCLPDEQKEGDGLFWTWDKNYDFKACVITADCVPVLVLGKKGGGLLHAGWRGIHQEIILQEEIEKIEPLYFYLGPSILWDSYEVGEEFHEYFPKSKALIQSEEKLYFSLQSQLKIQVEKNYPNAIFEDAQICTFKNKQYNSYRREKLTKRNWNIFEIN